MEDPLIGKSLGDVLQDPSLVSGVKQLDVRGAYDHQGTSPFLPGEIAELTRQYREAREMSVEPVHDRNSIRRLVLQHHPFIDVSNSSILYNADRHIIVRVYRE